MGTVFGKIESVSRLDKLKLPEFKCKIDYSIVSILYEKLKKEYKKASILLNDDEYTFIIHSSIEVYQQISEKVQRLTSRVVHKRLCNVTQEMINYKSLKKILQAGCDDLKLYGVVEIISKNNHDNLEPGAYLVYFQDCPELNSSSDLTFETLLKWIDNKFGFYEIYLSIYYDVFKIENLE